MANISRPDAGCGPGQTPLRFEIDFLEKHDAESIVGELKRVADLLGTTTLTAKDLEKHGRAKYHAVRNQFGSLRKALDAAGLKSTRFVGGSDEEILQLVRNLWVATLRDHGRRPRTLDVGKYGLPIAAATVIARFGTWKRALILAAQSDAGGPVSERTAPRPRRRLVSAHHRYLVFKRDLYRCRICQRAGVEIEVDHIVPLSQGGADNMDNLQTLCRDCNRGKGGSLQ